MATQSDDDFDKELAEATETVETRLSARLKLPSDVLGAICPSPVDRQALEEMMQVVNSAASENDAKLALMKNVESYAAVIVRLVKTVAIA